MSQNRTKKSIKNISYSVVIQVLLILINFISRTIFIHFLGSEYLGINGLYTNILTVLSLAELGFGNAIIYSMYKPLSTRDEKKLAALMNFYKKIYHIIIGIILILGLSVVPFLQYFINSNLDLGLLKLYYILFLLNTVSTYVFSYRISIINADQNMYLVKVYHFWTVVLQFLLQTIFLIFTHNYIIYLCIQIICTLINNIAIGLKAEKMYPYIKQKVQISKEEKKEIFENVKATFVQKISGTIVNNTDNILISIMIGTIWVGYYSNYYLIVSAITSMLTILFSSVSASVGNLIAEGNTKRQNRIFSDLVFVAFWICGVCSICCANLFNDFIQLWAGNEYVLSQSVVWIIVINFYVMGMLNPVWTFRDTTGLFRDTKWISIILAIINLVLSIVFGIYWGLFGILAATFISRLLTTYWYTPYMLYKKKLQQSSKPYFLKQMVYVICLVVIYIILYPLDHYFIVNNYVDFFLKAIVEFLIINVLLLLLFFKTNDFQSIYNRFIKNKWNMIKSKILKH